MVGTFCATCYDLLYNVCNQTRIKKIPERNFPKNFPDGTESHIKNPETPIRTRRSKCHTYLLEKLTRIAGYCASSTDCSDHSLKKNTKLFLQSGVVFFLHVVIKKSDQKKNRESY